MSKFTACQVDPNCTFLKILNLKKGTAVTVEVYIIINN